MRDGCILVSNAKSIIFAHQKVLKCGFFDGSIKLVKFRWMWIGWMDDMFIIRNRFFNAIYDLHELDLSKMSIINNSIIIY